MGLLAIGFLILESIALFISSLFLKEIDIDVMRNFNKDDYNKNPDDFGDHSYIM